MTINIDTLRKHATQFAKRFENTTSEKSNDQDFMRGFCAIFGISSRRIEWQYPVKDGKSTRFIDGLLVGKLLIEMQGLRNVSHRVTRSRWRLTKNGNVTR